jgi:hypothetical protein
LPVKSAGWVGLAAAIAASTCARVISADTMSGEVTSTCRIMSCAPAETTNRANIPVATTQIDARPISSPAAVLLISIRRGGRETTSDSVGRRRSGT